MSPGGGGVSGNEVALLHRVPSLPNNSLAKLSISGLASLLNVLVFSDRFQD